MPSYLDFDSTKRFRDFILSKTLNKPNGPQTFTQSSYTVQNLSEISNIDLPEVDYNRPTDLLQTQNSNLFKPLEYFVTETLNTLPRRANLQLYPYFNSGNYNFISIMSTDNYDTESELMKFAATNIRNNPQGPVLSRISRNIEASTNGRLRILDALNGNTTTAINIVTGREPLIESNNKITVAKTLPGKAIDFLQTVAGTEFPWSEIPGDYLSDPRNPINYRPEASTQLGKVFQDVTGVLGSLIGIQRRPKLDRKPSDLMIEYLGEGQKNTLYDNLSYSRYAPNYTTTARSQNSSKIFNFIDNVAQGVKNILGVEAPTGVAYIGDDRGNDVKYAMGDFNDRQVRSSYYLSLMFDPIQAQLFQRDKNLSQGGTISGNLTWISKNSKNKYGTNNEEWDSEQSTWTDSLSTNYEFREDSILGYTQEILNSLPLDGASSRSHVANVIDQTSRFFKDGDVIMSRGSAIKYVKNSTGEESGIEYCRVWTKDRSYMNYSDTMKRTGNIRKFEDSVISTPWNLNIGPMSNGKKSFDQSTNITPSKDGGNPFWGEGFYAKKYMFSIENLAWKTSNLPGFTVQDLPYCERGPNGGRVMWFPPYDLKVSEQNNAKWDENNFLGRPEPIYTYNNTTRSGQISFKVIVDHPSILNLLVREHFEGMSDEESDNYINAFFAGCEELDFYDLIRTYTTITTAESKLIKEYLEGGADKETIKKYRVETDPIPVNKPDTAPEKNEGVKLTTSLLFANDRPSGAKDSDSEYTSLITYEGLYKQSIGQSNNEYSIKAKNELEETLNTLLPLAFSGTGQAAVNAKKDIKTLFGVQDGKIDPSQHPAKIQEQKDLLQKQIDKGVNNYDNYIKQINTLKEDIIKGNVQEIKITVMSSCSAVADDKYNYKLSIRRSHSIFKDIVNRLSGSDVTAKWINLPKGSPTTSIKLERVVSFKDLGFTDREGNLIFESTNMGEKVSNSENKSCSEAEFLTKSLKVNSAIAFGCRQSQIEFNYTKAVKVQENQKPKDEIITPTTRLVDGEQIPPSGIKKPKIDLMKKIIMKTLSECYYFKTLEEKDPVVFGSLKEKLKYFHPAFHSMTPEGLNSRLTFVNQCVRPGDTIPIKGLSDASDLNARNTTFGPPPVCVLRIGDFYHSKIIIRDVNITFEDTTWDMNPEGIGMQPMLANVSLQVSFIGGQGLSKPVERLQNALSSNFYANTEMYDERSITTNSKIGGLEYSGFTKQFLESLQVADEPTVDSSNSTEGVVADTGIYIGNGTTTLIYDDVVKNVFDKTEVYFESFKTSYNLLNKEFGPLIMKLIFSPDYRKIKNYDIFTSTSLTPGTTIELIGKYPDSTPYSRFVSLFKKRLLDFVKTEDIASVFAFDKVLTNPKIIKANELLRPYITELIEDKIGSLDSNKQVKGVDERRNELIIALDEVNFLVKYGYDAQLESQDKAIKATLSGYTSNLIYDEYKSCIEYINENSSKFYEKLDNTIDYTNPVITSQILGSLLSVLLSSTGAYNKNTLMEVFDVDKTIFDENTIEKLKNKITSFIDEPKDIEFKIKKMKERKNSNPISFNVIEPEEITDSAIIDQVTYLNSKKVPIISGKLNYYRNVT
jgi:hypothetical protein